MSKFLIIKNRRVNKPAKAGIFYSLSAALSKGAALLFTPIYTRLIPPGEYALYSAYTAFMGVVGIFVSLQLSGSVIYSGLSEFSDKKGFVSSAAKLMTLSLVTVLLLSIIFRRVLVSLTTLPFHLIILLTFQVYLDGIRSLYLSESRHFYRYGYNLSEGIVFSLGVPMLSLIFIAVLDMRAEGRIFALFIVSLLFSIPSFKRIFSESESFRNMLRAFSFLQKRTLPMFAYHLSSALVWQIGKFFLLRESKEAAALLAIAVSVGFLPSLVSAGMQSALIPWIGRKLSAGEKEQKKVYGVLLSSVNLLCIVSAAFITLLPELFGFFAPKTYLGALPMIYPIAAAMAPSFVCAVFSSVLVYKKKTFPLSLGSVSAALLCLLLNFLLIRKFGYTASAAIQPFIFIFTFAVYGAVIKFKVRPYGWRLLPFLLRFLLLLAFAALCAIFTPHLASRILILISLLVLLFPCLCGLSDFLFESGQSC